MARLPSLKRENGYRLRRLRISPDCPTGWDGVLLSRELAKLRSMLKME
jgi:hypothetical protein